MPMHHRPLAGFARTASRCLSSSLVFAFAFATACSPLGPELPHGTVQTSSMLGRTTGFQSGAFASATDPTPGNTVVSIMASSKSADSCPLVQGLVPVLQDENELQMFLNFGPTTTLGPKRFGNIEPFATRPGAAAIVFAKTGTSTDCVAGLTEVTAISGHVQIDEVQTEGNGRIKGSFDLVFSDGTALRAPLTGAFDIPGCAASDNEKPTVGGCFNGES